MGDSQPTQNIQINKVIGKNEKYILWKNNSHSLIYGFWGLRLISYLIFLKEELVLDTKFEYSNRSMIFFFKVFKWNLL